MHLTTSRLVTRVLGAAVILLASAGAPLAAQQAVPTGRVTGRILDAATGQGIASVGIQIVGTTLGAMSGIDGRYTVTSVPAGTVTIQARRIGYQPKTVTGIMLDAHGVIEQDITLEATNVQLEAVTVSAAAERGSVSEALDQQRTATGIVNAITQEQIARSPDGDAAQAVQRVSGVTVQDGKYVVVRGLGERYTQTSLNGARLPSPEPEKRVVPLDLFPSGLLQTVTTSKTFTPDLPGDFSGAQVNLQTREFPLRRTVTYSSSVGSNSRATARDVVGAPRVGQEWLGFAGSQRTLPGVVDSYGRLDGIDQAGENAIVRSFRDTWSPVKAPGSPNVSMSASVGGEDPVLGTRIGYLGSLSYSYAQEVAADEVRSGIRPSDTGTGVQPINRFVGETGRSSVLWGGLLNLTGFVSPTSRISLNTTYSRSADNEAHTDAGYGENLGLDLRRTSLRFVERSIRSNQLRGEHLVASRHALDWDVTSSGVTRDEPDRADLLYQREASNPGAAYQWANFVTGGTQRIFGELDESTLSGAVNYRVGFGDVAREVALKVGASHRATERDVSQRVYAITGGGLTEMELRQAPEAIFGDAYTGADDAVFDVRYALQGGSYVADETVSAGYGMLELPVGSRIRVIGGARVERWDLGVTTEQSSSTESLLSRRDQTDVLPAAVVNVKLTEMQNLRFSASRTLSRPDYREISPATFASLAYDGLVTGNPELRRALIDNYDARWEWYPNAGEVLTIGVFAKRFADPIERTEVLSTGAPVVSFVNAQGAENYGVELEVRKGLGAVAERLAPFSLFSNVTLMRSEIRLDASDEATQGLTSQDRPMVGQAPYVVNAGLSYADDEGRASATLLYNVVGERLYTAGLNPVTDAYERPRSVLDLSLQFPLLADLSGKLDAKNLLDAPVEITQDDIVRSSYRTGRSLSLGLSWRP